MRCRNAEMLLCRDVALPLFCVFRYVYLQSVLGDCQVVGVYVSGFPVDVNIGADIVCYIAPVVPRAVNGKGLRAIVVGDDDKGRGLGAGGAVFQRGRRGYRHCCAAALTAPCHRGAVVSAGAARLHVSYADAVHLDVCAAALRYDKLNEGKGVFELQGDSTAGSNLVGVGLVWQVGA